MKKKLVSTSNLIIAGLIACTGLAHANMLTNPGFETAGSGGAQDPAGWFRTNPYVVQRYAEIEAGHGDWKLLLQDNDNNWHWASQVVPATAGREYTVSVEFKGVMQAGEAAYLYMGWLDASGVEIGSSFSTYTTGDGDYQDWAWVTRSVTAVAPAGAAQVSVRVMSFLDGQSNSAILADNVDVILEPATTWSVWDMGFEGGTLQVIYPDSLSSDTSRILWLIEMADRSMVTTNPLGQDPDGFIEPGDVVVCSQSLLMWFDATGGGQSYSLNGGGGMLRGIWSITRDGSGNLNFARIVNGNNLSPNLLRPGYNSAGVEGSGFSLLGNYPKYENGQFVNADDGFTFGIEHEGYPLTTAITGTTIMDGGRYTDNGVFVQFSGYLANSLADSTFLASKGLGSHYDVDMNPYQEGRVLYVLGHRIPEEGDEFRMEISLYVDQNNFGDLATLVISHNIAGYDGADLKYSSVPALNGNYIQSDSTQYYMVPGYSVNFYNQPWNIGSQTIAVANTTPGTGDLLGVGLPQSGVPFFEFRPVNVGSFGSEYRLQPIDWRLSQRSNAIDIPYFDINLGHPQRTYLQGYTINLINDYYLQ